MEQVGGQDGAGADACSGLPSPHGGQDPQDRQDVVAVDEVHDESDTE